MVSFCDAFPAEPNLLSILYSFCFIPLNLCEQLHFDDNDWLIPKFVECSVMHLLLSKILELQCLQITLLPWPCKITLSSDFLKVFLFSVTTNNIQIVNLGCFGRNSFTPFHSCVHLLLFQLFGWKTIEWTEVPPQRVKRQVRSLSTL